MRAYIAEMRAIMKLIEAENEKEDPGKRNFKPIDLRINTLDAAVRERRLRSHYTCTPMVIINGLDKMRACSPIHAKKGWKPGSAEAKHAEEGQPDIPEGINYEWQMDLCRAYIARAAHALVRERFLIPLDYLLAAWEEWIATGARGEFETASDCLRACMDAIEKELPDPKKRTEDERKLSEWAKGSEQRKARQQL